MDIAKIRKKALSKDTGQRPPGKAPVPGPGEEERKEPETEPAAAEEIDSAPGEMPAEEPAAGDELQEGIPEAEDIPAGKTEELVELLTFSLSREVFAFGVPEVEEIVRLHTLTRIPTLPDYVLGVTSLRGKIIPVIDLKTRLNLRGTAATAVSPGEGREAEKNNGAARKILIISGPKGLIGAAIDRVMGVVRLPVSEILDPPGHLSEDERKFLKGIAVLDKRFVSLIRADAAMDIETG
jgi:purine-binding chemotaxis protein CheW